MARRTAVAGIGLAALALVACTGDSTDTAAPVSVSGAVVDESGAPVASVRVSARPHLAPQEIDTSRLSELDALGFACIDDRPPPACGDGERTTETGADGTFALTLREAPGPVLFAPQALTIAVSETATAEELSGPAASGQLLFTGEGAELPPTVLWNPALTLEATAGVDAVLRWDHAPAVAVAEYRVLVEDSDGRLVWQDATNGLELLLRLPNLAESRGAISVVAVAADGPERFRSARVPYRADEGRIRAATVEEVDWPVDARLPPLVVLAAIVSLLLANVIMVMTAGVRHRRQLAQIPVARPRSRRR